MDVSAERFNASAPAQLPGAVTHRAVWAACAGIAKILRNALG